MKKIVLIVVAVFATFTMMQAQTTSQTYKFKGQVAERLYSPAMPYSVVRHEQDKKALNAGSTPLVLFTKEQLKSLFNIDGVTGKRNINDFNFVFCTKGKKDSDGDEISPACRLKFYYNNGANSRDLLFYRDDLRMITLRSSVVFESDDEIQSISSIEAEILDDVSDFDVTSCYFISKFKGFDFTDMDGANIGNAYVHPSFLVPSNGVRVYPYGEGEGSVGNLDDYVVETTEVNSVLNADGSIRFLDPGNTEDTISAYNPTLLFSLDVNVKGAGTGYDLKDVTFVTVDRCETPRAEDHEVGSPLWRWIFCERTLTKNEGGDGSESKSIYSVADLGFKRYNGTGKNAQVVSDPNVDIQWKTTEDTWWAAIGVDFISDHTDVFANLSNYDKLQITTNSTKPRFAFNYGTSQAYDKSYGDDGTANTIMRKDNGNGTYTYTVYLGKIRGMEEFVHLNGVKFADASSSNKKSFSDVKLLKDPNRSNYNKVDKDAIHFYTSAYNGDFTQSHFGCHGDDHANKANINHIYFQCVGAQGLERLNPATGKYEKVNIEQRADGKWYPKAVVEPYRMHMKDICLTKNRVEARQNHVDVEKLFEDTTNPSAVYATVTGMTMLGAHDLDDMHVRADLTGYQRLMVKGSPNKVVRLFFNNKSGDTRTIRELKLDALGYAELNLSDPELVYAWGDGSDYEGGIYLNSVKSSAYGVEDKLDYIRAVKDKDDAVATVLTKEMFHTWNGGVNATVTRKIANNGMGFTDQLGSSVDGGGVWLGINGTRGKEFNSYAELTGYRWMKFTGDANAKVRILANTCDDGSEYQTAKVDETIELDADGVAYMDISDHQYFHLNVLCSPNGAAPATLSKVELIPDCRVDYVLEGNGVLGESALKALKDPTACVIDARPRVNNSQFDLNNEVIYDADGHKITDGAKMANQNCLIMMRGDFDVVNGTAQIHDCQWRHFIRALFFTNAIIVPSDDSEAGLAGYKTSAGMFLVDGFPYRIPYDITLTGNSATYTRNLANKTVVNTICTPFPIRQVSKADGSGRGAISGEESNLQFYKITDLVHNASKKEDGQGLLGKDEVNPLDYVFRFAEVNDQCDAYVPYVFVNAYNDVLRSGEVEFANGGGGVVEKSVNADGTPAQAMNNAAHKTMDQPEDQYYLVGTNASTHVRNVWYFNGNGQMIKSNYMTSPAFRAVMQSPYAISDNFTSLNPSSSVKVLNPYRWSQDAENAEATAIEATDDAEATVAVYSTNGVLLRAAVKQGNALEGLPNGIYIVGGKKAVKF